MGETQPTNWPGRHCADLGGLCVQVKRGNELWVANVGDSRCVMAQVEQRRGAPALRPVELSRDHKPNDREEMARVKAMGGAISELTSGPASSSD